VRVVLALVALFSLQVPRPPEVPYVPTPPAVVDAMLDAAGVTKNDVVYDLGCGDGRIVIAAAKRFGARGLGVDVDPKLIAEAKANADAAGVSDKVTFRVEDLYDTDLRGASVIALYLLPSMNRRLVPKLRAELKPGSRIVSNSFDMGSAWPADRRLMSGETAVFVWKVQ
jgi:tRNA G10  N-methylase Trm11